MSKSNWNYTNIFLFSTSILIILASIFCENQITAMAIMLSVLTIVFIVIDLQAPRIANLSADNPKVKTLRTVNRITASVVLIMAVFEILKPLEGKISQSTSEILIVAAVSLFMMVFGNIAPKIPFNRYVGLRLPWTVSDEDTWKLAHKIVGYTAFPLAIIQLILAFFINAEIIVPVCVILWIAIPGIQSGIFYYKKFKGLS